MKGITMNKHVPHSGPCNHGPEVADLKPVAVTMDGEGATLHIGGLPEQRSPKAEINGDAIRYTDEHGEVSYHTVDHARNKRLWAELHRRVGMLTEGGMARLAQRCEVLFKDTHTWATADTFQLAMDLGLCFQSFRKGRNFGMVHKAMKAALGKRLKEFTEALPG